VSLYENYELQGSLKLTAAQGSAMAEEYQKFIDFDWSDERWQTYLNGLYPPPVNKQLTKFKKKWYKKNIDPDFDDTYEPPSVPSGYAGRGAIPVDIPSPSAQNALEGDGDRWAKMGPKATICFLAYAVSLFIAIAAVGGAFPAYQALVVLVGAFILEILAKYGLKFNVAYVQSVLLDDVGVMPMMALTLLTPGLHPFLRILALAAPFSTALLSFATISTAHPKVPLVIRDFFAPLGEKYARYKVMQGRADVEVGLGLILVIAVFSIRAAPISVLLYWNFMMMRYMMSPWTQASFCKVDGFLNPVLGKIPLVKNGYAAIKRGLYSFVDPQAKRSGSLCSIL
jgi:hypothetical protein